MARANQRLIDAIDRTIERIQEGAEYQWGHMGMCNCGHLVQALTKKSRKEIHAAALLRAGDWGQQSIDYCPTSGLPLDSIISEMLEAGLSLDDIHYLERLNDPKVLARLPLEDRWMKRNNREHLVRYLTTWNALLKEEFARKQEQFIDTIISKDIQSDKLSEDGSLSSDTTAKKKTFEPA